MKKFFDYKISTRVFTGFAIVLAGLATLSAVSYWTSETTIKGIMGLSEKTARARLTKDLSFQVAKLNHAVEVYTHTGLPSAKKSIENRLNEILKHLQSLRESSSDSEKRTIERLQATIDSYKPAVKKIFEERDLQEFLMGETLPTIKKKILEVNVEHPISDLVNILESAVYLYLHNLNYPIFNKAVQTFDQQLSAISDRVSVSIKDDLLKFRDSTIRTTQAIRSYLYLESVVLAGQTYEFTHLTELLRENYSQQAERASASLQSLAENAKNFLVFFSLTLILIGLGFSWLVGRSISNPILKISEVLENLSKGSKDERIPSLSRGDEIGVMAKAAEVFRMKNEEAENLLRKQKDLTQKLELSRSDLERSNDELDQFVYTVSHDLKTPLVTSTGFIGMIDKFASKGELEKAISKLPKLRKANSRMKQLIDDLLELSRVGRVDLDKEWLDTSSCIAEVIDSLQSKLNDVGLKVKFAPNLPFIYANQSRLLQIIENIVSNAIKYVPGYSDQPVLKIDMIESSKGDILRFKDNGPGIDQKYHKKIFELFQRLDTDIEGTGVGLAIVQKIMKFHGGKVWLLSDFGHGCNFHFEFPRNEDSHGKKVA